MADAPSGNGRSDRESSRTILLIDDDPIVARAMRIAFELAGHDFDVAVAPEEAYSRLASRRYDAVLLDLNFTAGRSSGEEGLACLARILATEPATCVLVITAHSGIRIAVAAMQAGARDFAMKPWRNADLIAKVEAAIARDAVAVAAPSVPAGAIGAAALLGDSPAIVAVRDLVRRIGPTSAGVAITGRSGTGRSLAARALHAASAAAAEPLVTIDLRDMAIWDGIGALHGTVVLRHPDRLGEVEQARLLARLPATVRTIAIADDLHPLSPALRARIATVEIAMPPLAGRPDDALLLARHFVRLAAERHGLPAPRLTPGAETLVRETAWPDEVRGLALAIERAVLLAGEGTIDAAALAPAGAAAPATVAATLDLSGNEKAVIAAALREHNHNVTKAAETLGLSRGALYRRMERHGL